MIRESIVITTDKKNNVHVAPMGIIFKKKYIIISPFVPSQTYSNLKEYPYAVINFTDDVKIFSDCILGKKNQDPLSKKDYSKEFELDSAKSCGPGTLTLMLHINPFSSSA